jgi:hypothetical protein
MLRSENWFLVRICVTVLGFNPPKDYLQRLLPLLLPLLSACSVRQKS